MPETKNKKAAKVKAETPTEPKPKKQKAVKTEYVYALEPLPEKVLPPTEFSSESEVSVFIGQLIKMSKYKTALEIGVFKGESSIKIIEALPNGGQYVGIDIGDYRNAEAEKAMQLAPVQAQIVLAKEIGNNEGYQKYLVTIEQVKANQAVGIEQAHALAKADVKVIANSGNVENGMKNIMDIFSSNGGTQFGAMLEGLAQTEHGEALLQKVGFKKDDTKK